jgi:septal ring factor EnvC (AmiA/AmiB activator)
MQQVDERFNQVDERFNQVDKRFNQVDKRLSMVENSIVELNASHVRLLNTVDGFVGRIDKYETELAARDHQFQKLLIWARKVSEKTGIPLENL